MLVTMSSSRNIKVYGGLTLKADEICELLPTAQVAPPVERGDLARDLGRRINVVVIIDGKFHHSSAVSPTEILDALRAGIRVYGASSMGALRAAELHPHGMLGHGLIFERFRTTPFLRDDFVGQTYDPRQTRALSFPLVDLQFALERATELSLCTAEEASALEDAACLLHYSERTLSRMLREAERLWPADMRWRELIRQLLAPEASQKRRDALSCLARVATELSDLDRRNAELSRRLSRQGAFARLS
jgi:TfuA protein